EQEFANNPSYVEMYRRGNAYHGAHPFFMWYWGENGRQHVGKVIAAGAENAHVPAMLGWERADNLTEAIAMARTYMGNSAEITMLHQQMIGIADMELFDGIVPGPLMIQIATRALITRAIAFVRKLTILLEIVERVQRFK